MSRSCDGPGDHSSLKGGFSVTDEKDTSEGGREPARVAAQSHVVEKSAANEALAPTPREQDTYDVNTIEGIAQYMEAGRVIHGGQSRYGEHRGC